MTRASHRLWLCALCVLGTAAPAGCLLMRGDSDDCGVIVWDILDDPSVRVEPSHSRVEYRIVLTLTAEGAASEAGHDVRMLSHLKFYVGQGVGSDAGDVGIDRVGLSRADGSDVVYGRYSGGGGGTYTAVFEFPLSDCGEGECRREFLGWAEVSAVSPPAALLRVRTRLTSSSRSPECETNPPWLQFEVERIADPPDASTAPPDGGVGP